jgi:hypothetical protein
VHPLITTHNSEQEPSNLQLSVIKLFSFPPPFIKLSHKCLLCIFKCSAPNKGNRNSSIMVCPSFYEDYFVLIYTHFWELVNSMGSHGSLTLPFVMKVMVSHFVSDLHEIMIAFIVMLPLIIVVEISLQLHQAFQVFCAFSIHLFLGFRVYPPMQSIGPIIHYSSCLAWFLVSICGFVSFNFPPSLYLCDLVSLLLLASLLEFLPLCFSQLHLHVCFYFLSNTFSIFIYFFLHFSPCFYVPHFLQLYLHQYFFLSLCFFVSFSLSIFLSPCDFVCHSFFNS